MAIRACCSPFELPVGNGVAIGGLLMAWPAATFAFKACIQMWVSVQIRGCEMNEV